MIINNENNKLIEMAIKYEEHFSANQYNGNILSNDSFIYQKGDIPILLSAPHAVNHVRNGEIKYADMYTGSIIKVLQELTGCHVIYKTKNDNTDPNYDTFESDNGYKKKIIDIINENNIKLFIDLHGAAESRDIDIDLGTNLGKTLNGFDFIPGIIEVLCDKYKITNVGNNKIFNASSPNNVTNTVGNICKIPALQFEINRKYRDFNQYLDNYNNLINALREIIIFFKDFNLNLENIITNIEDNDQTLFNGKYNKGLN